METVNLAKREWKKHEGEKEKSKEQNVQAKCFTFSEFSIAFFAQINL